VLKSHVLLYVTGRPLLGRRTVVQEVWTPGSQNGGLDSLPD